MSKFPDIVAQGVASGWHVTDAASLHEDSSISADVVIIGTGAGGGVTAEMLTKAGLKVVMIEEGALKSSKDFNMVESEAYPQLYQEALGRRTKDGGIAIMQGRTVGGGTTVNWCASFRTPQDTLGFWQAQFGLQDYTVDAMAPWFAQAEKRLNIAPWALEPNENNALLAKGAAAMGYSYAVIPRNVRGCANLGYCGMGCPINAKQSMLVTTIPEALKGGARLYTRLRAQRFTFDGGRIASLVCDALAADGIRPSGHSVTLRAKHYVLSGGAINSPGLLLRSQAPDPHGLLGKRSFVHPTVSSGAIFEQRVDAFQGAPQSVYSDHFLHTQALTGPLGYKLEVPPLHPVLMATSLIGTGEAHAEVMRNFANYHVIIALLRDGFHPESVGGSIGLRADGMPQLDYPQTDVIWEAARRAYVSMAEMQFAAGARKVNLAHSMSKPDGYTSLKEVKEAITDFKMTPITVRMSTAHLMGGCGMAADEKRGVVNPDGRHFHISNLSVHDGSLFPTSLGVNPQLSIYGVTARMSSKLAHELTEKPGLQLA